LSAKRDVQLLTGAQHVACRFSFARPISGFSQGKRYLDAAIGDARA